MDELKPCPFCGDGVAVCGDGDGMYAGFYVACQNPMCFCCVGEGYDRDACPNHQFATEELAVEAWNRRTPSNSREKGEKG